MGEGGCTSLCSAVNSCGPLEGLITQVSLETPPPRPLEGGEPGKTQSNVCCVCGAQIIIPRNTFIGKNLFIKDPSLYFPVWGGSLERQAKIMLQTRGCLQRHAGDSFHHLFHISTATYFSFKRQLRPNWVTPNVAYRGKTIKETRFPRYVYEPTSKHVQILRCSFLVGVVPTRCQSSRQNDNNGIFYSTARPSGILCI